MGKFNNEVERDYSAVSDQSSYRDYSLHNNPDYNNHYSYEDDRKSLYDKENELDNDALQDKDDLSNYKNYSPSDRKNNSNTSKGGFSGFVKKRKKSLVGGLSFVVMGGGMLCGGAIISGPVQLIHGMNFLKEHFLDIFDDFSKKRAHVNMHSLKDFAKMKAQNHSDRVRSSRVGVIGDILSDRKMKRMAENGIEFDTDVLGTNRGVTIDPEKFDGDTIDDENDAAKKKRWASKLNVDEKYIEIKNDGKIHVKDSLGRRKITSLINRLNKVGRFDLLGHITTRAIANKIGKLSVFHPIKKAKEKAKQKLVDWMKKKAEEITNPAKDGADARKKAEDEERSKQKNACSDPDNCQIDEDKVKSAGDKAEENFKKHKDLVDKQSKAGKAARKVASKTIAKTSQLAAKMSTNVVPGLGIALAIIDVGCTIEDLKDTIGMYQMVNIVNVAQGLTGMLLGFGSQVMSGDDIDLEQAGLAVQGYYGGQIDETTVDEASGEDIATGEKVFSSFWHSQPVKAELGDEYITGDNDGVPSPLKNVGKSILMPGGAAGVVMDMLLHASTHMLFPFDWLADVGTGKSLSCWVNQGINDAAEALTGPFVDALMSHAPEFILSAMDGLSQWMMGLLAGDLLNIASALPVEFGAIATYGAHYMMNEQARSSGGRILTSQEAHAVKVRHERYLAEKHLQKPLLARLFDPTDYNSTLSQVARAANFDVSSQNLTAQFGNVAKFFASAPTLLFNGINKITSSAEASSSYDYGVPMYGYSVEEQDQLIDGTDYELIGNIKKVIGNNDASEGILHNKDKQDRIKKSAGVTYNDSDGSFSINENTKEDGTVDDDPGLWTYIDDLETGKGQEWEAGNEEDLAMRAYLLDYNLMNADVCMEGDASDSVTQEACNDMSVDAGGGGGSSFAGENMDVAEVQSAFVKETGGVYRDYTVANNGCTTISYWYIGEKTDLQYGRGNGKDVVRQLVAANPDANLKISDVPVAGSIFSAEPHSKLGYNSWEGHTGLIVSVDGDTVTTLESGSSLAGDPKLSYSRKFKLSDFPADGVSFVYVGDHLK